MMIKSLLDMKQLTLLLLCVVGMASSLHAQTEQVSGRLVDENHQPVAFANVVLKPIDNDSVLVGTTSDENGAFALSANEGTYNLVASSAGYERQAT
jgi:hypothetical protein